MGELNSRINRAVWFDIPVSDLDRAVVFYQAVLGVRVDKEGFGDLSFGVIEHRDGNGGCLVPDAPPVAPSQRLGGESGAAGGVLLYLNVDGRIRAAVDAVVPHGGSVIKAIHGIGPHGYRAIVLDSEGNRVALHSNSDA